MPYNAYVFPLPPPCFDIALLQIRLIFAFSQGGLFFFPAFPWCLMSTCYHLLFAVIVAVKKANTDMLTLLSNDPARRSALKHNNSAALKLDSLCRQLLNV